MAKKGVNYLYGIDFTDKKAILESFVIGDTAASDLMLPSQRYWLFQYNK